MTLPHIRSLCLVLLLGIAPQVSHAQSVLSVADKIDIVFIALSAILVFFMQAGFALLESGMVRAKNTINVMMKNYVDLCVVMLVFWLFGYGLMWGDNPSGLYGTSKFLLNPDDPGELLFLTYQTMFAATAATIVSGALAERINFGSYILISVLMSAIIYPVFGSWAWAEGGWLKEAGFIDFAGATVVHSTGGWCAFAAAIILGPRLGRFANDGSKRPILGHNLTMVALAGFILWFGWYGFNLGSSGTVDESTPRVLFNTTMAGAAGGVAGVVTMWIGRQHILLTSTVVASIGGLVAVTAGAATMTPAFAAVTGAVGGVVSVVGINALDKMGVDDAVGAVPCHAFAGFWGTLAAGLFLEGNMFDPEIIIIQLAGAMSCMLWAFLGALMIFGLVNKIIALRVTSSTERRGLDFAEHYEIGYPEFQLAAVNPGKQGR
ncbi:MAG: ammonium transporter [Pseudomonadota bacterium]